MKNNYEKAVDDLKEEFPEANIEPKDKSFLMKVINVLLIVITFGAMGAFMTNFVTTIGDTIYVPRGWTSRSPTSRAVTLRHEAVHIRQKNRYGSFLFSLRYIWWPLPTILALGRLRIEQEAYEESLRAWLELEGDWVLTDQDMRSHIIGHFTGANYFWTYPFRSKLEKWYDGVLDKLKAEAKDSTPLN